MIFGGVNQNLNVFENVFAHPCWTLQDIRWNIIFQNPISSPISKVQLDEKLGS